MRGLSVARGLSLLSLSHGPATSGAVVPQEDAQANDDQANCRGSPEDVPDFESFIVMHDRSYTAEEYDHRRQLYEARVGKIREHNCREASWTATVNHLSDRSSEELRSLHGWKGGAERGATAMSFLQIGEEADLVTWGSAEPAPSLDWRGLDATSSPKEQGACGSCWAFATATALGAHSQLYAERRSFSVQHLVQCVENPDQCGGNGGCGGATVELAMQHVLAHGVATAEDVPYVGKTLPCQQHGHKAGMSLLLEKRNLLLAKKEQSKLVQGLIGWQHTPSNDYKGVLRALQDGPLAVAVQAMDSWVSYKHGIVGDDCPKGATLNHAVTLVGYGEESQEQQYWILQNSWGPKWGEKGFLRLRRRGAAEDSWCGWDTQPEVGIGCKGGPDKVWVCGTCGILFDPVRPLFQRGNVSS